MGVAVGFIFSSAAFGVSTPGKSPYRTSGRREFRSFRMTDNELSALAERLRELEENLARLKVAQLSHFQIGT
jgi:hypothetical protein